MALSKRLGWGRDECESLSVDEFWDAWDTSLEWEKQAEREAREAARRRT